MRLDTNQFRLFNSSTLSVSAVVADRSGGTLRTYDDGTLDLSGVNTFTGNIETYSRSLLRMSGAGQLGSGTYAGTIAMADASDFLRQLRQPNAQRCHIG